MSKRLFRNRYDKKIAGVSSGLAEYFDVDTSLVRIAFILLTIFNGIGIIAYIIFWIALPERSFAVANQAAVQEDMNSFSAPQSSNRTKRNGTFIFGLTLIALGCIFLLDRIFPQISGEDYLAICMIISGSIVIYSGYSSKSDETESSANSFQYSSSSNESYPTVADQTPDIEPIQESISEPHTQTPSDIPNDDNSSK